MRQIRLHDTMSGELVPLHPREGGRVRIYVCGPTVYGRIHIGNARPFVVFMVLKRFLAHLGYEVTLVINITDINDKIYDAAREKGLSSVDLAAQMKSCYLADTDALGLGRPDAEPLASESMQAIVSYIRTLMETGHAYSAGGDVFFSVRSDPRYGVLSHRSVEEMDQGEGIHGAERKRDPLDFALWKAGKEAEDTSWEPREYLPEGACPEQWAAGRPGWHIECSAMAESLLGVGFEIHGGGSDLVFPHHENEASQTRTARGEELAQIWMHNGMVRAAGEKMAKSVGNIASLREVLDLAGEPGAHAAHTVIMYLLRGHYRQPLAFSAAEVLDAERSVYRIRDALRRVAAGQSSPAEMAHHRQAFFDALAEDFNTPKALAALFAWVRQANSQAQPVGDADLREMLSVLGMADMQPLQAAGSIEAIDPQAAELLREREKARRDRDFERADALREQLIALGWQVRDGPDGAELIPTPTEG